MLMEYPLHMDTADLVNTFGLMLMESLQSDSMLGPDLLMSLQ